LNADEQQVKREEQQAAEKRIARQLEKAIEQQAVSVDILVK